MGFNHMTGIVSRGRDQIAVTAAALGEDVLYTLKWEDAHGEHEIQLRDDTACALAKMLLEMSRLIKSPE